MPESTGPETQKSADVSRTREFLPVAEEEVVSTEARQSGLSIFAQRLGPPAIMRLQRAIGNTATIGYLKRHYGMPGMLQRAGDPEGMMKYHHASGFTYHHIIPENKLHDFWHNLDENKHFSVLRAGLTSVVERGMAQLKEVGTINIKNELKKEIPELVGTWDDSKFDAITTEAIGGATPEQIVVKHMGDLKNPDHALSSSYNPVKTILSKAFKVIGQTKDTDVGSSLASADNMLGDAEAKAVVEKMVMWMPGNIHRGPSTRFTPKDKGFDKDVDDGGNLFEEAAKQVISSAQYKTVSDLNAEIDKYNANPTDPTPLATIGGLLTAMKAYSVTDYNPDNWEQATVNKKKAWRLKKKG